MKAYLIFREIFAGNNKMIMFLEAYESEENALARIREFAEQQYLQSAAKFLDARINHYIQEVEVKK